MTNYSYNKTVALFQQPTHNILYKL